MKNLLKILTLTLFAIASTGCAEKSANTAEVPNDAPKRNSIYHWKTTFDITPAEVAFLEQHSVERIYLRMFDIAVEYDFINSKNDAVPIATTKFLSEIPEGVEVVPVTYITIDALRLMAGKEQKFAQLIVDRLLAMASYNGCGNIKEIQLDCDWTISTMDGYYLLCQKVKERLESEDIALSVTVRLHQLRMVAPPADRGVLMLYNTGALKNSDTKNSILDIADVKPYMTLMKYPLPLDYAYPTFGWGVKFKNDKFVSIVSSNTVTSTQHEYIRRERPTPSEILAVKALVEKNLGKPTSGNILYHLDNSQLKNYTNDEIAEIYSY